MPGFPTFVRFEHIHTKSPIFINPRQVRYVIVSDKSTKDAPETEIHIGSDEYEYIRVGLPIDDVMKKLAGVGRSD